MKKNYLDLQASSVLKIVLVVVVLITVSLACNKPDQATQADVSDGTAFVQTSVALTMAAMDGDSAPDDQTSDGDDQDSIPPSETPEPPTPTLTPTVTDTPTPEVARVYASANTNCRTGQGTYFPWLVTIKQGETPEAVGVDTSGDYWYVRRPDSPSQFCWMWGKYATPQGPWQSLPVYTPIPTPTPGFDYQLTFLQVEDCGILWGLLYQIDNIGSFTLESWKSSAIVNSGSVTNGPNQNDKFFSSFGCSAGDYQDDLTPGEAGYLNVVFDGDPTGSDLTIKIRVCTEDGLGGDCLKKEFDFKP